jgi:hypothetical protein
MPRAPTSLSLSPGSLSQCRPEIVLESEMMREIGRELEFPKTYFISGRTCFTRRATYSHSDDEVGLPFLEAKQLGDDKCSYVGDDSLDNKDHRNDCEVCQLLGSQLRGEFGEDCGAMVSNARAVGAAAKALLRVAWTNSLRQGVNSCVLRLARNFWLSASNWPILAIMYPGALTHTTSMTASNTSNVRFAKSGCELCGALFLKTSKTPPLLP